MTFLRTVLLGSAAISALALTAAEARAEVRRFNVPAQPARTGIPLFAHQAGIQILAPQSVTDGLTVNHVEGEMEVVPRCGCCWPEPIFSRFRSEMRYC